MPPNNCHQFRLHHVTSFRHTTMRALAKSHLQSVVVAYITFDFLPLLPVAYLTIRKTGNAGFAGNINRPLVCDF